MAWLKSHEPSARGPSRLTKRKNFMFSCAGEKCSFLSISPVLNPMRQYISGDAPAHMPTARNVGLDVSLDH